MSNPWLNPDIKWISQADKEKRDAASRKAAADALSKQSFDPPKHSGGGGLFSGFKSALGGARDIAEGALDVASHVPFLNVPASGPEQIANLRDIGSDIVHRRNPLSDISGALMQPVSTAMQPVEDIQQTALDPAFSVLSGEMSSDGQAPDFGDVGSSLKSAVTQSPIKTYQQAQQGRQARLAGAGPATRGILQAATNPTTYAFGPGGAALGFAGGAGQEELNANQQNIPGWRDLDPETQAAITQIATMAGQHFGGKPLAKIAKGIGSALKEPVVAGQTVGAGIQGPGFSSQRLNQMIEDQGRFPTPQEVTAESVNSPELRDVAQNYNQIKALHDAHSPDLRGASDIDAEINKLTQEQLNLKGPNQGAHSASHELAMSLGYEPDYNDLQMELERINEHPQRDTPNFKEYRTQLEQAISNYGNEDPADPWNKIEEQIQKLEAQKSGLRSVDTASEKAAVAAGPRKFEGNDISLADEIQRTSDQLARYQDRGFNIPTSEGHADYLQAASRLKDLHDEAASRNLDMTQFVGPEGTEYTNSNIKAGTSEVSPTNPEGLTPDEQEVMRKYRAGELPGMPNYKPPTTTPEVSPEPTAPELPTDPMELGKIARDRNDPRRQAAMEALTQPFAKMVSRKPNAPRQEVAIADIPSLTTEELRQYRAFPEGVGEHFRRAVEREYASRPDKFAGLESGNTELKEGYVRLYRGVGNNPNDIPGSGTSGRWFSPNRDIAQGYAGANGTIGFVDVPRDVAEGTQIGYSAGQPTRVHESTGLREEVLLPKEWADMASDRTYEAGNATPASLGQSRVPTPEQVRLREERNQNIGGGANPERLVTQQPITPGLTTGEKIGNVLKRAERVFPIQATLNDPTATPIVREAKRVNTTLINQSGRLARQMKLAESVLNADKDGLVHGLDKYDPTATTTAGQIALDMRGRYNLTPEQEAVLKPLQRTLESVEATRKQFNLGDDLALRDTYHYPTDQITNAESATNYMKNLADKASRSVVKSEAAKLQNPLHPEVEVPPEVQSVIDNYLQRNIGSGRDAGRLYNNVNNTLRSLWARADMSRVFIQDLPMLADNPKEFAKHQLRVAKAIQDPNFVAKMMNRIDEKNYGTDTPTIAELARTGLELSGGNPAEYEKSGLSLTDKIPVLGKVLKASERAFTDGGDLNRIFQSLEMWKNLQLGIGPGKSINGLHDISGLSREEILTRINRAVNRSSGTASTPLGGDIGRATLFAPRFLQSQLESITHAFTDGGIEGQIARRQLTKMIILGVGATIAANATRGEETDLRPWSSNFLRIRNVGGRDVSLFGPWDSLVRGIIKSSPSYDRDGNLNLGDPSYLVRTKLSPILSTATDLLTGSNVIGQNVSVKNPGDVIQSLGVPFSFRDTLSVDKSGPHIAKGPVDFATGIVGLKSSPLTEKESLDNRLTNAGIEKSDPDYLIKKREWLAENPQGIPEALQGDYRRSREIRQDITDRRAANSDLLTSGGQSLTAFRDNRTKLLTEQRNKLEEISKFTSNPHTQQEKWLASYFKLFDSAKNPITHDVDGKALDPLIAEWSAKNGPEALDFVNRYTGSGLSGPEKAYYDDLQTLQKDGYFSLPRLQKMRSGMSEDQILKYRDEVSQARLEDPKLQKTDFGIVARRLLGGDLSPVEIQDIVNAGKQAYANPKLTAYQNSHRKELMWFNPRATWSTYQGAKNKPSNTISGAALKAALG